MSTVEDADVIDWLAADASNDRILLAVIDREHLFLLQEKLNAYLRFVESGEVFERVQETTGRDYPATAPIEIQVRCLYSMSPLAARFFDHARRTFEQIGLTLVSVVDARAVS